MKNDDAIEVLLYMPDTAPRKLSAKASTTIGDLLQEAGVAADLLVFGPEDEVDLDEADVHAHPVAREKALRDVATGRVISIHCHRCHQIQVTVNYQKESIRRKLLPSTRARKVLRWAKRKLKLTDADADNLALFLCNGGEQVRETTHLGELAAAGHCELCFDLSKDRNIEGVA